MMTEHWPPMMNGGSSLMLLDWDGSQNHIKQGLLSVNHNGNHYIPV